jgi:methane/ammonia monooxygenase subunit A
MVLVGSYHIHAMLTMGDWDFWVDWKDRRLWVTVVPIVLITFPAAVQSLLWERFRLPWGATVCVLGLLFGEWINRYFNFWGWTYFPITMVFPSQIVPGAILLDVAPVSAFFSAFMSILIYFLWNFVGRWFSTVRFLKST